MKKPKEIFGVAASRVKFFLAAFSICLSFAAAAIKFWVCFLGAKIKSRRKRRKRAQKRRGE